MNHYLRLIRLPNLIMLGLMQGLFWFALVKPILVMEEKSTSISTLNVLLVILSCILIAGGGYIINDVEDQQIDQINKPSKKVVGNIIPKDAAYNLYMTFTFIGVLIAFYLSFIQSIRYFGIISLVTAGLLYFYATAYKCIPALGNFIISFLTALSIYVLVVIDPTIYSDAAILTLAFGYMVFSFLLTMVRELIKDLEDQAGDAACGCSTMVVKFGPKPVKVIAFFTSMITLLLLIFIQLISKQWENMLPFLYVIIFIEIPLVYLMMKIWSAVDTKEYGKASLITKLIMFTGVISMLIFYFSFQ
ncbi:geranylgeranylglycerol-phosphate geranylgeranyltransferase [soil metagenome]